MKLPYIDYFIKKPKSLLLVDGIGAFYTASMLLIIKNIFINYISLPLILFDYLAIMAYCMGLFSLAANMFVKKDFYIYLRVIAIVNFIYCTITLSVLVLYYKQVMIWEVAYFVIEVLVVLPLILIEIRVSQMLRSSKRN
jgi:hypothetical protein